MTPPRYNGELAERYAVWSAHKGMCCYCGKFRSFNNSVIDHIIPQKFNQYKYRNRLNEIIDEISVIFQLQDEFAIDTFYNVVSSCYPCNLKKGGKELPLNEIVYFLRQARDKYHKVQYEYQYIIRDRSKNEIIHIIINNIKKNNINIQDVNDINLIVADKYTHYVLLEMDVWQETSVLTFGLSGNVENIDEFEMMFNWDKERKQSLSPKKDQKTTLYLMSLMNNKMYNKQYLYTGFIEKNNGNLLLLPGKPPEIQLLLPPAI